MSERRSFGHIPPPGTGRRAERVWRVRKDSQTLAARLVVDLADEPLSAGVELQVFYNGDLIHGRRWASRELAIQDAGDKLKALQIAGWTSHW